MAETFEPNVPWHRLHDPPVHPGGPKAPLTVRPSSLQEIIDICKRKPDRGRLHALGSHWALSEAARSDSVFIETHDPDDANPALGRTLPDVIPDRMDASRLEFMAQQQHPAATYVHIESGKRICQLYAELDQVDPLTSADTLAGWMALERQNRGYAGPWGFATMGGAGGQTVVGALITGTHGGDFDRPPLADSVIAMHLVTDGGKHYWIERQSALPFADREKLIELYGADKAGRPSNFEVLRDDDVFNALAAGLAWGKTLLIVTHDEHSGFYDHVLPPSDLYIAPAPLPRGSSPGQRADHPATPACPAFADRTRGRGAGRQSLPAPARSERFAQLFDVSNISQANEFIGSHVGSQ